MSLADMQPLAAILQDERVMYAYNGAFSEEETLAWMQKQLRRYRKFGFGLWAVLKRDTGEMIGQCGITMQEYRNTQVPEIGYLFAYKHWHQGYATEAAIACREYGFKTLHFDALYSIIRDTNIPSQNVALRNGMKKIDSFVKHYRGEDMPHWVYRVEIWVLSFLAPISFSFLLPFTSPTSHIPHPLPPPATHSSYSRRGFRRRGGQTSYRQRLRASA